MFAQNKHRPAVIVMVLCAVMVTAAKAEPPLIPPLDKGGRQDILGRYDNEMTAYDEINKALPEHGTQYYRENQVMPSPIFDKKSSLPFPPFDKGETQGGSLDSVRIKIESKLSLYEQQMKLNAESIAQLEKELEERKKLNERFTAAVLVCKEILNEMKTELKSEPEKE